MTTATNKNALARFKPLNASALIQAQDFLNRGGVLIRAHSDSVVIERMGQLAHIDTQGRVRWEEKPKPQTSPLNKAPKASTSHKKGAKPKKQTRAKAIGGAKAPVVIIKKA